VSTLQSRLADVDQQIDAAIRDAGRQASEITRIVVTKFHPASLVSDLAALGVRDVGENRQQELTAKRAELADLGDVRWHFIGQAQTNKARQVRAASSVVHSVDRIRLTDDAGRGGVAPQDLDALVEHVLWLDSLRLRGIMAVAPLDEAPASAFTRLAGYAERVRALEPAARWISAGMSHDFAEAIACGATHLRIGSAITGERPARG